MGDTNGFQIRDRGEGESLLVELEGELDLGTIPQLRSFLEDRLDTPTEALVLDLSEVSFMDSSGLRLLIELDQRSRSEGWGLSLIPSVHESANTVLRMTGADRALPFIEAPAS